MSIMKLKKVQVTRTCAALVMSLSSRSISSSLSSSSSSLMMANAFVVHQGGSPHPFRTVSTGNGRRSRNIKSRCLLSSSSSFQAPIPPQSKGQAVYADMERISSSSSIANARSSDTNAVFVVTGASRGIGYQFVKMLLTETKVRTPRIFVIIVDPAKFRIQ